MPRPASIAEEIVAAATELFQEHGFDETTTAEIATRAEIGAGAAG